MSQIWKKTIIVMVDILLAVYLVFSVTTFNRPDELSNVCTEVKIDITDDMVKGFLNPDDVKAQLQHARLYPLGDPLSEVNIRKIEESLCQNLLVETAQCWKTQTGKVCIQLKQRLPVVRVKADNGDDYYLDSHGKILPSAGYASDLVVATGKISRKYAQKHLTDIGNFLIGNKIGRQQVEQLNVLGDGSGEMVPRVGNHTIILGSVDDLREKFENLEAFYEQGLSKYGWNKYKTINLKFKNQIVCTKRT
jgi:cell division protein FtsQ